LPVAPTRATASRAHFVRRVTNPRGHVSALADPWGTLNYTPGALGRPKAVSGYASDVSYHLNGAQDVYGHEIARPEVSQA